MPLLVTWKVPLGLLEGRCRVIRGLVLSKFVEGGLAPPGATLNPMDSADESAGIPSCGDMPLGAQDGACRILEGARQTKFASRPPVQAKLLISGDFSKLDSTNSASISMP
jgi:hypothetical protein